MATSSYFARPQRNGTHRGRLSISNALPVYSSSSASSSAVQEKYAKKALQSSWWIPFPLRIPGFRRLRVFFLNPRRLHDFSVTRFGRKRGSLILCLSISCLIFFAFALAKRFGTHAKQWPTPFTGDPPTLVYKREDLQRIWQWEVTSGHYPSRQRSELFMIYPRESPPKSTSIQYQTSYDLKMPRKILPYLPEDWNHHLMAPILQLLEEQVQNVFILIYKARRKTAHTLLDRFQEV